MLTVVTFKWSNPGYRSQYTAEHVNIMRNMIERHYPHPHRFVCVTDDPVGLDPRIEYFPIWDDYADLPNPSWPDRGPSCYRRLKVFDMDDFGERFVCIDLDAVIVGDLSPLWNRPEDLVVYRPPGLCGAVCGSMFLQTAWSSRYVWEMFNPLTSPQKAKHSGYKGSDQGWLSYCLPTRRAAGLGEWNQYHGVYDYCDLPGRRARRAVLPADARIVFFHGKPDPWECRERWIKEAYK